MFLATATSEVTLPPEIVDLIRSFGGFDLLGGPAESSIADAIHYGQAPRVVVDGSPFVYDEFSELTGAFVDTGCRIWPTCLSCPLSRCQYEEGVGFQRAMAEARRLGIAKPQGDERHASGRKARLDAALYGREAEVLGAIAEGLTVAEAAKRFGVAKGSVQSAFKRHGYKPVPRRIPAALLERKEKELPGLVAAGAGATAIGRALGVSSRTAFRWAKQYKQKEGLVAA